MTFRVALNTLSDVHGLPLSRDLVIEPRMAAKAEDHVFHIVSPLRSDEHLKLVQELAEE